MMIMIQLCYNEEYRRNLVTGYKMKGMYKGKKTRKENNKRKENVVCYEIWQGKEIEM